MKFKNKMVLVFGLGDSGRSAVKLLSKLGAKVFFYDDDVQYAHYVGYVRRVEEEKFDYCILSPGVTVRENKTLEMLIGNGTKILSELDLGYLFLKGRVVAVTGTNGKTTATSLLGKIFERAGKETFVCGNIGLPISAIARKTTKKSFIVCHMFGVYLFL